MPRHMWAALCVFVEGKVQVCVEGSRHNSSGLLWGEGRARLVSTGSRRAAG